MNVTDRQLDPEVHIPGILAAIRRLGLPHRVILATTREDKELTKWTQTAFTFKHSQIDWSQTPNHHCVQWAELEDLVAAFRKLISGLDTETLVTVMWFNAICPLLEMQLKDIETIASEIFEEHEASHDIYVFNRNEGWLIEMHHEGTLCYGRSERVSS